MKRRFGIAAATFVLMLLTAFLSFAGEWKQENDEN